MFQCWELESKDAFAAEREFSFKGLIRQKLRPYLMQFKLWFEAVKMTCF